MNIYLDDGYVDMGKIMEIPVPFIFVVGGRGTGKTYRTIDELIERNIKFFFMRRTQTQADIVNIPDFAPYKTLAHDKGYNITSKKISKYNAGWYMDLDEDGGLPFAYTGALSTLSNMRGFDAHEVKVLVYDEFIPESHERTLKNEAKALYNAFETMNRNRELTGLDPLKLIALANSEDVANPLFLDLGLVKVCLKMKKKNQRVYINRDRGIAIIDLSDSDISERKKETALYRLNKSSDFNAMALGNNYNNEQGRIRSKPIKEYKPIVVIGELCIYEHKSNGEFYATTHVVGNPPKYTMGDADRARFIRVYRWIWDAYMENEIEFEEYLCEVLLTKAFK